MVCPHECGTNRTKEPGAFCRATDRARIVSFGPHFGEEKPLVGQGGSGTIFFGRCNLRCVYCQNYDISQADSGNEVSAEDLADIMLQVQEMGCENLNLVSPTHYTPQILDALDLAAGRGLNLPLVWNTGTFERLETLRQLDGVVDIYLPDTKYADPSVAKRLSGTSDYPQKMHQALREMHRQVGDLVIDRRDLALRGLMVRHLVLPGGLAGTADTMQYISQELSPDTYVNVMGQYRPEYRAKDYPEIARLVTVEEVAEALRLTRLAGLSRLDC
jgi:putative pyruvate formate lyase activating enzyme